MPLEDPTSSKQGEIAKQDKDTWLVLPPIFGRKDNVVRMCTWFSSTEFYHMFSVYLKQ